MISIYIQFKYVPAAMGPRNQINPSAVIYAFAKVGGSNTQVMGVVEIIGILLYLSGSYINTHSEYSRHVWKLKDENR